jgi:hypothetical protein
MTFGIRYLVIMWSRTVPGGGFPVCPLRILKILALILFWTIMKANFGSWPPVKTQMEFKNDMGNLVPRFYRIVQPSRP